jgi:release factor glutamine methyltransferase
MTPGTPARAALQAATVRLAAAGVEGAARDARRLLAHALGIDPARLTLALDAPLGPAAPAFAAAVAARAERRPLSHITGRRAFMGRDFRVTPDVLDPRPETEVLIAAALAAPFSRVLDLGTGSGAILLTLLAEVPGATGLGTDVSEAALAVARDNARALGVGDRAAFCKADWLSGVAGTFDLIVSNPPYIAEAELAALEPEVQLWEPRAALTPGGDGLGAYRAIAAGAAPHLAPGGRLILEIGAAQGVAVPAILAAEGWTGIAVLPDLDGRDRVVVARRA